MFLRKPIKPLSCLFVLWTLCLCLLNRRYERAPTTLNQSNPHSYELIANFGHKPKIHSLVMTMKNCFLCLYPLNTFTRKGRGLVVKNIWEFTHKDFLAIIRVGSEASKGLKGFFYVFFLNH